VTVGPDRPIRLEPVDRAEVTIVVGANGSRRAASAVVTATAIDELTAGSESPGLITVQPGALAKCGGGGAREADREGSAPPRVATVSPRATIASSGARII